MNQTRITKPKITAYLKEQCGWSRGVRSVLAKYGLSFEEKEIHNGNNYEEMVMKSGQHLQPTLIIDDTILPDISGLEVEQYLIANRYLETSLEQTDGVSIDTSCTEEEEKQKSPNLSSVMMTSTSFGNQRR